MLQKLCDGVAFPLQLVNCGLSDITIKALEARGITALFPIQKHVYEPAAAGTSYSPCTRAISQYTECAYIGCRMIANSCFACVAFYACVTHELMCVLLTDAYHSLKSYQEIRVIMQCSEPFIDAVFTLSLLLDDKV